MNRYDDITTTKRPRNKNRDRKNRRKNRKKNKERNRKKNKEAKNIPEMEKVEEMSPVTVTALPTAEDVFTTKQATIWVFNHNTDNDAADDRIDQSTTAPPPRNSTIAANSKPSQDISAWKIYTAVGAVGGLLLLIGLLAITLTLCCRHEDEAMYKSTPV